MNTEALRRTFRDAFAHAPTLLAASPGRINLIGEHTDYNDGFVLPASIDREAVCALRENDADRFRLAAADLDETLVVSAAGPLVPTDHQWANYLLGVVSELRRRGHRIPGFDCALSCDVPQGAGLSSSAAIECALAKGLAELCGLELSDWDLVLVGQAAENDFVGAHTGFLDQFASVFGRPDTALLLDCRSREATAHPLALPGYELLALNTGVQHNHLTSGYAERRASCEQAVKQLHTAGWKGENLRDLSLHDLRRHRDDLDEVAYRRAKFVVEENDRVLSAVEQLAASDARAFGKTLYAGHWGLSHDYEVSCPESDAIVAYAQGVPYVTGARQMGGGFGGCVLCVVEAGRLDDFTDEVSQDYFDRFGIQLDPLAVRVGPGARVLAT